MAIVKCEPRPGADEIAVEVPDTIIEAASKLVNDTGRDIVVGEHPVFGLVYRDEADVSAVSELRHIFAVDATGLVNVSHPDAPAVQKSTDAREYVQLQQQSNAR